MKNVTITLDEQTAAWVRMAAANNFEWVGGRRPTREEIHDRARAREDLLREELARQETK